MCFHMTSQCSRETFARHLVCQECVFAIHTHCETPVCSGAVQVGHIPKTTKRQYLGIPEVIYGQGSESKSFSFEQTDLIAGEDRP